MKPMLGVTAALMTAITLLPVHAAEVSSVAGDSDWPQFCGPNRDSVAVKSPKLLDTWPKEGPPLVWKSDWIPGWNQGGCGGPAVADGKVFVYATAKNPVGGGSAYKLLTPEVLANAGWLPDLPAELSKKIEDARVLKGRPSCAGWPWWEIKEPKEKDKELDAFLAKKPELDKYIQDFIATIKPEDAKKYGDYIKKRLCMPPGPNSFSGDGVTWAGLEKLSKLQGMEYPTLRAWAIAVQGATGQESLSNHFFISKFLEGAWKHGFTRSDTLTCLDATTGKSLWKKEFPFGSESPFPPTLGYGGNAYAILGICGTPAVWEGKCYFGGAMGLYCLSTKDGTLLWQAKSPPSHTSVLATNGVVYYCGAAYQAGTGQLLWKTPLWKDCGEWASSTPPSFWKSGGKTYVLAHNGSNSMCCLDLETGKDFWAVKVKGSGFGPRNFTVRNDSDILVSENKIYRMTPTALQPLQQLEETEKGVGFMPGVMSQDHFYGETSGGEGGRAKLEGLCCWDFKTGDLKWCGKELTTIFCAPPMLADGKLITVHGVPGQEGWIYNNWKVLMIRETAEKYMPLGTFEPGLIPWTPMAFAGGKLFVRTEVGISCYDLAQYGPYLDKTVVTNDKVTFTFKQTGGGLVVKDAASGLKDVVITDAKGAATPAKATVSDESIVVDIKDVPVPFGISCGATNALIGKNGKPVPTFEWNEARLLKFRTCFDNTMVLTSDLILPKTGTWNAAATYAIAGATVTNVKVDPLVKTVTLTTDKTWKAGEAITLTYPRFPVDQGEAVRETLTFAARDRSAARFVKVDETTSGNWKGVYGAEGAVIAGDANAASKIATVTPVGIGPREYNLGLAAWPLPTNGVCALQKWGEAKDRIAARWAVPNSAALLQIDIDLTDGKEHLVALYCLDLKEKFVDVGRAMTVEVWDPWRNVVLVDKQNVKEFSNGKYLVWSLKGHVALRIQSAEGRWFNAVASGIFFDAPAGTGK